MPSAGAFFGRHQFIKVDHTFNHFGPHPTNISPQSIYLIFSMS